jgi:uncharacterized protein (DUF58 family)
MIRPTPRAVVAFAAGIPPALLLMIVAPGLWIAPVFYAALTLAALGVDALASVAPGRLEIAVETPQRLHVGEPGAMRVAIAAPPGAGRPHFEMIGEVEGAAEPQVPVAGTLAAERLTLEAVVKPFRRGRLAVRAAWLRWQGPLGLAERRTRIAVDRTIDVLPDVRGIERAALQFLVRDTLHGTKVRRELGEGAEFETLREFAPGHDHRFIDWKRSAHHRKLLTRTFRAERNNPVVLAFDTGHLMLEPVRGIARLDHAIEAALLLGWISLRNGDLVGLYGFDAQVRHYLEPAGGMQSFKRLQHGAAAIDYATEETNFTLGLADLERRLHRRSLVVLFTEFVDTVTAELLIESLGRMASRHVVVFITLRDPALAERLAAPPDRFRPAAEAVIAHDFLRERAVVLERIARLGAFCLDAPPGGLSAGLLNRYLLIKQRGLI